MAGVSGFEPERSVLETLILPLYYTPISKPVNKSNSNINSKKKKLFFYLFKYSKIILYSKIKSFRLLFALAGEVEESNIAFIFKLDKTYLL